jgi:2-polyprenyl-3-methyl-5-hydroxy-6-metoxy-1,4-benzoquinol methylase
MPDFQQRSTQTELMDNLGSSGTIIDQTLHELEFINTWLGGNHVTLNALSKLLGGHDVKKKLVIADLGCGGGDMLRLISTWTKRRGYTVKLIGVDANPNIAAYARHNLRSVPEAEILSMDIFSDSFQQLSFDVVIGTLFFHHFTDQELTRFFRQLKERVRIGIIINDIHRHPLAFHSIRYLTKWFSRSPMVVNDAPLSVLRAFQREELISIIHEAGYPRFSIRWKWAFRWQVIMYTECR